MTLSESSDGGRPRRVRAAHAAAERFVYRWRIVLVLTLAVAVTALGRTGSFVAGGADSYGYISEARLWLDGALRVRQDVMQAAPWPDANSTFTPLGYEISRQPFFIVPVHAPGLPLLMAAAVLVGGWCAAFWVVPLAGGALVVATYAIGARLGRPIVGLAAALLVATSPAVLVMLLQPMSDLPAAAAFAAAVACILAGGRVSAFAGGLLAGLAILIRPNLVPVAIPLVLFVLVRDITMRPRHAARFVTPWFAAAAAIGALVQAAVNDRLYGSPLQSGYGSLDYRLAHVWPNVRLYGEWLVSTQTPALFVGLASLAVPWRRIWITAPAGRALWFFVLYVAAVVVPFLFYSVNEAWWYLRYLLPMWPVAMLGLAACLAAISRSGPAAARLAAMGAVAVLALYGWAEAGRRGVFDMKAVEQKYIDAARLVEERTGGRAAIFAAQHSGSVRHYAGRMTVRWDMFRQGTLDAAIDWLDAAGYHPYLLVEPWEADLFRRRYGRTDEAGRLDWAPRVTLEAASTVFLYDFIDRSGRPEETETRVTRGLPAGNQCVPPAPWVPHDW